MHRMKERFRYELMGMEELSESARWAKDGFFKYRQDFVRSQPRVMEHEVSKRFRNG